MVRSQLLLSLSPYDLLGCNQLLGPNSDQMHEVSLPVDPFLFLLWYELDH